MSMRAVQPPDWSETTPAELIASHLARPRNTRRAYRSDLRTFAAYLSEQRGAEVSAPRAVARLLASPSAARRMMEAYATWCRERYESMATARRKIQCLQGLMALARRLRIIVWAIDPMRMGRAAPVRDTRGPDRRTVEAMLTRCREQGTSDALRDAAAIEMMAYGALRAGEALSLDVDDLDLDAGDVLVLAKGAKGRVRAPLPRRAIAAVREWLSVRGDDPGPLLLTCGSGPRRRWAYKSLYDRIVRRSSEAGRRTTPHGLRHFAATRALQATGGNIPEVMAMMRHQQPGTLMAYNDRLGDGARRVMERAARHIDN
jgi:integrase